MKQIVRLLIGMLVTSQYSCNNAGTNSQTISPENIKIENQDVNIDYTDSKIGDTTIWFVHGGVLTKLIGQTRQPSSKKKYSVVTVDLPAFGKPGKNRNSWTVENYGKDISVALTKPDSKIVILAGHSMSGAIALETALTNSKLSSVLLGLTILKTLE